ncbi:MAG: hypothetical protein EBZ99_00945, partial [Actinobacteria bacterium]|nr:hypothetical protein [Actinomycetota bacterium]
MFKFFQPLAEIRARERGWRILTWDGDPVALTTLHECIERVTLLMAPMVPFITEHVWQVLIRKVNPNSQISVHLADFPLEDSMAIDS